LDTVVSSFFTEEETTALITSIKDKIDQYITKNNLHNASRAGFTMKTHQSIMSAYVISRLKSMNPDIDIVIGGITNEYQAHLFMRVFPLVDYAIWGEGEYPLWYLVEALKEGTPVHDVPNVVYREDGTTVTGTSAHFDYPLDSYPFADHTDFFEMIEPIPETHVLIPVWGSRSCPWNKCKFCVVNEEYCYRTRSPENIVKEIEYQSEKHKRGTFVFVDSDVAGNRKRFKTLLTLLKESSQNRGEPYHLCVELSPVFIDAETMNMMERVSVDLIQIGFEAVTDPLLKKMQKRHEFAYNIQTLKVRSQHNIDIKGNIITGIPTETREDVLESCYNLRFLRFYFQGYPALPNAFALYKGSAFYEEMSEAERTSWSEEPLWEEIGVTAVIPEPDRFEFFGFLTKNSRHYLLWDSFERLLRIYTQKNSSYEWKEYGDRSIFEEHGIRTFKCVLDRTQTDLLIFCDSVKTLAEVKTAFPHIPENTLVKQLFQLKDAGLLYCDKDCSVMISVVEADKRTVV
jgi:radical SAM superfamily enzyme YgiQ (UPF0313 family)